MCRRIDGEDIVKPSPIGLLPKEGSINVQDLGPVDWKEMFSLPKEYWVEDIRETKQFLHEQVGCDLPETIGQQLDAQEERIRESLLNASPPAQGLSTRWQIVPPCAETMAGEDAINVASC